MSYGDWEAVIGLEIHAQLQTATKMFSADSAAYGGSDNEHVSAVSLGMPGALPVPNKKAIEYSIKVGLALNCAIREHSVFARKNYFYPDLPKGYQISQYDQPICENGYLDILLDGEKKRIGITRAHMEEDAGKSTHHGDYTLINLNRAGVPLLEIVSEPDIRTPTEAAEYARNIRSILRYLEVCDGNLEEGSMRCDCNVSVRKKGESNLRTRAEIKNVNSFRFVEKAIDYEIRRQIDCYESGDTIVQETRLYDSTKNRTFSMRSKEEAHDYRYFPDPDLQPVRFEKAWVEKIKSGLPELPNQKAERFQKQYGLPEYDSLILVQDRGLSSFFEKTAELSGNAKASSNWIMGELLREMKERDLNIEDVKMTPETLAELLGLIEDGTISGKIAKSIFPDLIAKNESPKELVKKKGLIQISDPAAIEKIIQDILSAHPDQVAEYRGGKQKLYGFFVGEAMKATKGQANPGVLNQLLKKLLAE